MNIEPNDIINHAREMVLDDSAGFRYGIWDDIRNGHYSCIKYLFEAWIGTRINDYKTNKYYDQFNTNREHWVFVYNGWNKQPEYEQWLEKNNIKYLSHWMSTSNDVYYYFYKSEDAILAKLTWE